MDSAETVAIAVTPEVARLIDAAMQLGDFATRSELIRTALLDREVGADGILGYSLEELRQLGDEGEASGPGSMTIDEIEREGLLRARRAREA